jgi:hypothetical protein
VAWQTKDGRDIEFRFHEQDPTDAKGLEKGYVVRRVDAYVAGLHAGYLKMSYVPAERVPEVFPTVWHWFRFRGCIFNPEVLADTWLRAHHANYVPDSLAGQGVSYLGLTKDMIPDEDTMRADLATLADKPFRCLGYETPNETFAHFQQHSVDYAFVDYIKVFQGKHRFGQEGPCPEGFLRQGVGTALYNEGARWLAERFGLPLHGSGLQSDDAQATWQTMLSSDRFPIRQITRDDGKRIYRLDYTVGSVAATSE